MDTAPLLIPGVVLVGVVVALLSGGKNPVAEIGTTSKYCFCNKRRKTAINTSNDKYSTDMPGSAGGVAKVGIKK